MAHVNENSGVKKVIIKTEKDNWWSFPQFIPYGSAVMVVEGWNIKVRVSPIVPSPTITINGETFNGTREAKITIDPTKGLQRVSAKVTAKGKGGGQELVFAADTAIDSKSNKTRYGSTFIYFEYPSSINDAFAEGKMIEDLRRLVNAKDTQNVYLIKDFGLLDKLGLTSNLSPGFDTNTKDMFIIKGSNDNETKCVVCHEECHALNQKFEDEGNAAALDRINKAYSILSDSFDRRIGESDIDFMPLWQIPRFMSDPMNKLFMDGHYPGVTFLAGHPWDNRYELFASATTILRLFPDQFFDKLAFYEKYSSAWPGIADEARQIAKNIVLAWGSSKPFEKTVYDKLGLKIPK